ncbi:MAG: glycine radical domain-containing protein [Victivallis sp.]
MILNLLNSGNTLLDVDVIDGDKVLAAHENPSVFPDLVVRVTGFTASFSDAFQRFQTTGR